MKNIDELEFAIFCIENVARSLGKSADKVYDALAVRSRILQDYIVPCYETLHSQDRRYIVDEIEAVMQERGVAV